MFVVERTNLSNEKGKVANISGPCPNKHNPSPWSITIFFHLIGTTGAAADGRGPHGMSITFSYIDGHCIGMFLFGLGRLQVQVYLYPVGNGPPSHNHEYGNNIEVIEQRSET